MLAMSLTTRLSASSSYHTNSVPGTNGQPCCFHAYGNRFVYSTTYGYRALYSHGNATGNTAGNVDTATAFLRPATW